MDTLLKKHFWIVNLVIIGLCAIFAGRAVAHILTGVFLSGEDMRPVVHRSVPSTARVHSKDIDDIVKRNVFCSGCAPIVTKPVEGGNNDGSWQKSSLQLELVSTMICPSDDGWSMAVVRDLSTKEKDAAMFNRGKKIFATSAEVLKVVPKRVYIRNQGRNEFLEMEGAAPVASATAPPPPQSGFDSGQGDVDKGVNCSGTNCTVDKKLVESLLSNTAALATAARFIPAIKDGKAVGFKVYAIRPNSIFGKIGLQNGDTVKTINGMDISSPDRALEVYTKLRNATHLSVSVERRGETVGMDYAIR